MSFLLKKLGTKRLLLDDDQRRLLDVKAHAIVRVARENPTRGYDRIQEAVNNLGYHIMDSTVANALKAHGIEPAPDRQRTPAWSTFLKARRVHIAGITPSSNATWMRQVCRNLTDCEDGFLKDAGHLIVDRDTSFIAMRQFMEQNTDTEVILLSPKSPNLNAYMERWFRSLKSECLERMIFFGRKSLERAVREYV
jgi:putative transposase